MCPVPQRDLVAPYSMKATMPAPAWAAPPASRSIWARLTRTRILVGLSAFLGLYILSTILWNNESDILRWEDGAIAISYVDKEWTPYPQDAGRQSLDDDLGVYLD